MSARPGDRTRTDHSGIELQQFQHRAIASKDTNFNDDEDDDENEDDEDDYDILATDPRRKPSFSSTVQSFELYTPEEEKAVIRKFDLRVTLFMSSLYLLAFIDRSNIGNAKIAGLPEDLKLKGDQFEWLLTGFYITYILFEWMIMLYHILPAHIYISLCVATWGLLASLQSTATSFRTLLLLRLGLGVGEAAFSPGVPFYLSFFYKQEELALRVGMQVSAAPLAASFAGSLAWLITKVGGTLGPVAPWRLLFLVEGFPSVVAAVVAWFWVPDSAGEAWFLSARERMIARHRLRKGRGSGGGDGEKRKAKGRVKKMEWKVVAETLMDPKCYITAVMFLSCNIAFSSMPVFLPSIINEMGYSPLTSQALSAPPFLLAFLILMLTSHLSDRLRTRTPFICLHALLGASGYFLIALGGLQDWPPLTRYLCVYPAAAGFFSAVTLLITLSINNQESDAAKGVGMTVLNFVGQLGPLVGTRLYPDEDRPFYVRGMVVCGGAMVGVFFLAIALRRVLKRENERRAKMAEAEAEMEDRWADGDADARELRLGMTGPDDDDVDTDREWIRVCPSRSNATGDRRTRPASGSELRIKGRERDRGRGRERERRKRERFLLML